MLVTRYEQAARLGAARDVLEVACGAGPGLGYLAARARRVVGGDCTRRLLHQARQYYGDRIPLVQLDAQRLPFRTSSFDVVVLHEAIYYLSAPAAFINEGRRVLRERGALVISTVNREWPDFNPSPFSHAYPTARDLRALLQPSFRRVEVYGAFPAAPRTIGAHALSRLKRTAVRLALIPRTMRGKRPLKRLFLGRLVPVSPEITAAFAPCSPLVGLDPGRPCPRFKVLCAIAST